ncbi:ribosomal-protein-alanine acetyltransferase [compost metagenome]
MSYRIDTARADELPLLAPIERAAATRFPVELLPAELREHSLAMATLRAAQQDGRLWLARDAQGTPVGFACVEVVAAHALLAELDVHPEHGRRGLGAALLQAAVDWAAGRGLPALYLTTFRDFAPSAALYRKRGFVPLTAVDTPAFLATRLAEEDASGLGGRVAMRLSLGGARG